MKLTLRKAAVGLALSGSIVGVGATSASALECHNVSRAAPPNPGQPKAVLPGPGGSFTVWVVDGDWWFINLQPNVSDFSTAVWDKVPPGTWTNILHAPPAVATSFLGLPAGTVNGNFQAGQGIGLLDHSQAPCNANRQTQHGIQADCSPQTIP
jgi:hypothetical protein